MSDWKELLPRRLHDWRPDDIAGHAMISDMESGALVYRDGTIDWLALPDFDSELCFASLLSRGEHGAWWMQPEAEIEASTRRYVGETLILETTFETAQGTVAVTDFMPAGRRQAPDIVRIVEGRSGCVDMRSDLALRFSDGRTHPLVEPRAGDRLAAIAGPNAVFLSAQVAIKVEPGLFSSRFTVRKGESVAFVMTWYPSHEDAPDPVDPQKAVEETHSFWEEWTCACKWSGHYRGIVIRSLLALKGLTHARTGGMIAALTASLPESPGGTRNWDYRYCWLRDAAFCLLAFLKTGYAEEARTWTRWLHRALAGEPIDLQPFYCLDGSRITTEREADWLGGFGGAKPVRFGNKASEQLQLDVYGEAIDALFIADSEGIDGNDELILALAGQVEQLWQEKDCGLWESRGDPRHYVYSKVMCWVAFDRAARLCEKSERGDPKHWHGLAERVRAQVLDQGYCAERGCFMQNYDLDRLDAALLRLPLVGFIEADDARMRGTVAAIEKDLMKDGLVWRYKADGSDGLSGAEGSFLAASCWLADVYAELGRMDDAVALYERVCGCANDLGLLSEEYLPDRDMALGNFPQALSHVALVNSACSLAGHGHSMRADAAKSA